MRVAVPIGAPSKRHSECRLHTGNARGGTTHNGLIRTVHRYELQRPADVVEEHDGGDTEHLYGEQRAEGHVLAVSRPRGASMTRNNDQLRLASPVRGPVGATACDDCGRD